MPLLATSESANVVLPWSTCAKIQIFRMDFNFRCKWIKFSLAITGIVAQFRSTLRFHNMIKHCDVSAQCVNGISSVWTRRKNKHQQQLNQLFRAHTQIYYDIWIVARVAVVGQLSQVSAKIELRAIWQLKQRLSKACIGFADEITFREIARISFALCLSVDCPGARNNSENGQHNVGTKETIDHTESARASRRRKAHGNSEGTRFKDLLGHCNDGQTTCRILCADVKNRRFLTCRMRGEWWRCHETIELSSKLTQFDCFFFYIARWRYCLLIYMPIWTTWRRHGRCSNCERNITNEPSKRCCVQLTFPSRNWSE